MSTVIMSAVWPLQGMSPAQKAVLVSLADQANDEGVCWPSVGTLSKRTCLSERAVQGAVRWLQEKGALSIDERKGRSTIYRVTPAGYAPPQDMHPRKSRTPAANAPAPADAAPPPPQQMHPTPADAAPRTVKEPSSEPSLSQRPPTGVEPGTMPPAAPEASSPTPVDKTRGSRLPSEWRLPKAWGMWALEQRPELTADQVREMGEKFRDHWIAKPGKDGRRTDWQATWRNWVRNERSVAARPAAGQAAGAGTGPHWATTWSGIVAKGAELGLAQEDGELAPMFKQRVMAAANPSEEERARLRADHGVSV